MPALALLIAVLLFPASLRAEAPDSTSRVPDSTRVRDSTAVSAGVADTSFHISLPVYAGTLDRSIDSSLTMGRERTLWMPHRFLGDILAAFPGTHLVDQQGEGQYSALRVRGADWRSIAVMRDGRPLNDPATGIFNLYWFPTEYADRFELVSGPRAFVYGLNSTGAAVNIVTRNYNNNRPMSSLAYSEAGYNYSRSDGLFSQNVTRTLNLTAGFQAQGTDGRFPNADDDQWNSRIKVRFNPINELQLILSHAFLHTQIGLNGGVDLLTSGSVRAFDPLQAAIVNADAYEKVTRHDFDLSAVAALFGDTASTSVLGFYYSHQLREYRDEENRPGSNGILVQSDHTSSWAGVRLTQTFVTAWQRFQGGVEMEQRQVEGSPNLGRRSDAIGSVRAVEELFPLEGIRVAGFGRVDRYLHASYAGAGTDVRAAIFPWLTLTGGISSSRRLPTYQELFWTGDSVSRIGDISAERHLVAEAGLELRPDSSSSIRIAWFHRTIENPILISATVPAGSFPSLSFRNGGRTIVDGVEAGVEARIWVLTLSGTGTFVHMRDEDGARLFPQPELTASGGLYYWNSVLGGLLDLKAGVRGRYTSGGDGEVFNPEATAYASYAGHGPGRGSAIDGLLFARIGDAHIHFLWTNLTSTRFFLTPFYPVRDREIQFGITWQFLD
jgi:outer membrane cobalamin receptor